MSIGISIDPELLKLLEKQSDVVLAIRISLGLDKLLNYRLGTVNSKSFIGKVLLRIKRKFELTYAL